MREIAELGAREAIMTLPTAASRSRGDGHDRHALRRRIEPGVVESRSTVGSGDAFLAGYVAARYGGRPADDCLRFAVACGAESIQHFGAGVLDPREVRPARSTRSRVEALAEPVVHAGADVPAN